VKNVPARASPPPAPIPRVKVHCEQAPRSCRRDDARASGSLPACCEMIQMLNPACPGRAGAGQCRGAVASLGGPGLFSLRADLSATCQVSLNVRLRNWLAPYALPGYGVTKMCGVQPDGSAAPGELPCCRGDRLWCGAAPESSEQGELKNSSSPCCS